MLKTFDFFLFLKYVFLALTLLSGFQSPLEDKNDEWGYTF